MPRWYVFEVWARGLKSKKSPFNASYARFSRKQSVNHGLRYYGFIKKYNPRQQEHQTKGMK